MPPPWILEDEPNCTPQPGNWGGVCPAPGHDPFPPNKTKSVMGNCCALAFKGKHDKKKLKK